MSEGMWKMWKEMRKKWKNMRIHCFSCGKVVSNVVEEEVIIRGVIQCPECIAAEEELDTKHCDLC